MLIKLRLQCIGNVCSVLVYSQSVYSTQLCVHTEQWIHNFGLTSVLAQRLAVWIIPYKLKKNRPLAGLFSGATVDRVIFESAL